MQKKTKTAKRRQQTKKLLAANIEAERAKRGWSLNELLKRPALSRPAVTGLALGTADYPPLRTVRALADAFGLKIFDLLT